MEAHRLLLEGLAPSPPSFESHPLPLALEGQWASLRVGRLMNVVAERVGFEVARGEDPTCSRYRGPSPLAPPLHSGHPVKGAHPLQNPRSNRTLLLGNWGSPRLHSELHSCWRCGGEGGIRTHGPLRDNGFRDPSNEKVKGSPTPPKHDDSDENPTSYGHLWDCI